MEETLTPSRARKDLTVAWQLSLVVAVLMAIQSATGLVAPHLYRDTGWVTAAWYGNDLVTFFVAVPVLVWSLAVARNGSRRAELIWFALLGYAVYNYAFYLFGARLNAFFPVYVTLFTMPVFILIMALARLDAGSLARAFAEETPRRWIGGYMLFTAGGLCLAWLAQWANFMLTGTTPEIGEEAFKLVAAMDLSFMVPWFTVGAVLLLRRRPWGYVVAPIIIGKGASYTLVLTVTSTVAALRGVEGSLEQIPIWALWTLAGALALWGLLRNLRRSA